MLIYRYLWIRINKCQFDIQVPDLLLSDPISFLKRLLISLFFCKDYHFEGVWWSKTTKMLSKQNFF